MALMIDLGALLAAFALVALLLVQGGAMFASILLDEEPEAYLGDPAARRSVLRG
jgi:hypothetical protein